MDPEQPGGGGMMSSKILGIPTIVWVGGIALIVYFLFFRNSSQSAGSPSTSGGGGTIDQSGTTRVESGAVQITVTQNPQDNDGDSDDGSGNPQPRPKPKPRTKKVTVPNVVGRTYAQAAPVITKAGLKPHKRFAFTGPVTSETPKAGSKVPRGSTVDVSGRPPGPGKGPGGPPMNGKPPIGKRKPPWHRGS